MNWIVPVLMMIGVMITIAVTEKTKADILGNYRVGQDWWTCSILLGLQAIGWGIALWG
jgi:hypothetical protein